MNIMTEHTSTSYTLENSVLSLGNNNVAEVTCWWSGSKTLKAKMSLMESLDVTSYFKSLK